MRSLAAACLFALIASCDTLPVAVAPPAASSSVAVDYVVVTPASVTLNFIGALDTLEAVAYNAGNNPLPGTTIAWSSTKTNIATVNGDGIVQAVAVGQTRVIAEAEGKADTAIVRVKQVADSVLVTPAMDTINAIDGTAQLTAQAWDAGGTEIANPVVTWSSLDPSLATVNGTGLVTGEAVGRARIRAKSGAASSLARVTVRQVPVTMSVSPSNAAVEVGFARHFTASGTDANGHPINSGFTWVTSNTAVATAEANGDVAGQSVGTVTVRARLNGVSAPASLMVTAARTRAAIGAGVEHSCGRETSGAAQCWGRNLRGQLGANLATTEKRTSPVAVTLGNTFTSVGVGNWHSCGLLAAGNVKCWGRNDFGQIGDDTQIDRDEPVDVVGSPPPFTFLAVGFRTNCALTSGGLAYCWGLNNGGQVGDGSSTHRFKPVAVQGGVKFGTIAPGWFHSCGLDRFGAAYCWGRNTYGQLGTGGGNITLPATVNTGLTFRQIASGFYHSCAITAAGAAYCWGRNLYGQIGNGAGGGGTDTLTVTLPALVQGGHTFVYIDVDGENSCGITNTGAAYCWGRGNTNQIGDGLGTHRDTPTLVVGGHTFATIDAAEFHTCATTTANAGYCWGDNIHGQIGNGSAFVNAPTPSPVGGGFTFSRWVAGGMLLR